MTREEAIKRISEMIALYKQEDEDDTSFNFDDEDIKALDMAISALSESDNKELSYAEVEIWAKERGLVLWSGDMSEKALELLKQRGKAK